MACTLPPVVLYIAYAISFFFVIFGYSDSWWISYKEDDKLGTVKGHEGLWSGRTSVYGNKDDDDIDCDGVSGNACTALRVTQVFASISFTVFFLLMCVHTWGMFFSDGLLKPLKDKNFMSGMAFFSAIMGILAVASYSKYKENVADKFRDFTQMDDIESTDVDYDRAYADFWVGVLSLLCISVVHFLFTNPAVDGHEEQREDKDDMHNIGIGVRGAGGV